MFRGTQRRPVPRADKLRLSRPPTGPSSSQPPRNPPLVSPLRGRANPFVLLKMALRLSVSRSPLGRRKTSERSHCRPGGGVQFSATGFLRATSPCRVLCQKAVFGRGAD